jgi:hypothetical protein
VVQQHLLQRIVPQGLCVVAVEIAGEVLIDCLRQQVFGVELAEQFRPGIGQPRGGFGQDAQPPIELANRQQPGVGDDLAPIKGHHHLATLDLEQHQLTAVLGKTPCLTHRRLLLCTK